MRLGKRFFEELFRRTAKSGKPSPFERQRTLDPELWFDTQVMFNGISEMFPFLATAQIKERWAAHIDVTPDSLPVIDELTAVPGLFMCSGFSGHGFGIAPGAGTLMADLVTGAKPIVDPAAFRLNRFFKD
jgi:glycine/D-amino acid oxidase-like deaminating enzyme